jgi:hypothetical protein
MRVVSAPPGGVVREAVNPPVQTAGATTNQTPFTRTRGQVAILEIAACNNQNSGCAGWIDG